MTTARQRKKARSGAAGSSAKSKRGQQKRLHKKPEIKGSAAIRENWDPKLTVRQNYTRLGLVGDLSMRDSGGAENRIATPRPGTATSTTPSTQSRKGMARIERDAEGNVVAIHENDEEPGSGTTDSAADGRGNDNALTSATRTMWADLEEGNKNDAPIQRFTSDAERSWLQDLVAKHGEDTAAMANDRKANIWLKTEGQIRRAIRKAGDFDALRT